MAERALPESGLGVVVSATTSAPDANNRVHFVGHVSEPELEFNYSIRGSYKLKGGDSVRRFNATVIASGLTVDEQICWNLTTITAQ